MSFLPANDLIVTGIEDLQYERESIPALLVAIVPEDQVHVSI